MGKHIKDEDEYHHNSHDTFIQKHETDGGAAKIKAKASEFACQALWSEALEAKCWAKCGLTACATPGARRLKSGCVDSTPDGGRYIAKPPTAAAGSTKPATGSTELPTVAGSTRLG